MLMKNERLASLRASFDQESHVLTITLPSPVTGEDGVQRTPGEGRQRRAISADLRTAAGRAAIETFFADYCADELRGPPKILHADGHSFSDVARKVVSIINLASVAAVETMVGVPVNPLRFRGNVYVEGWPAWSELDLVGRTLKHRRRAAQNRQAHRPLRRHQCRSRHRRSATSIFRRRCCAISTTPIAGFMPR